MLGGCGQAHPLPVPPTVEGLGKRQGWGRAEGVYLGLIQNRAGEDPALAQLLMPWLMWREELSLASSSASAWGFAKQAGSPPPA